MAIADYRLNITNTSGSGYDTDGTPSVENSVTALSGVKSLNISYSRTAIRDRSDDSNYDTIFDVVNGLYRIEVTCRELENAQEWLQQKYIREALFRLYGPTFAAGCNILIENAVIETFEDNNGWGDLALTRLVFSASMVKIGDGADSDPSNNTPLEGEWDLRTGSNSVNAPADGDTINYWDGSGL